MGCRQYFRALRTEDWVENPGRLIALQNLVQQAIRAAGDPYRLTGVFHSAQFEKRLGVLALTWSADPGTVYYEPADDAYTTPIWWRAMAEAVKCEDCRHKDAEIAQLRADLDFWSNEARRHGGGWR